MRLVQSAKLNGHDPWAYLRDVLERLPNHPNSRIEELLPHRWQKPPPDRRRLRASSPRRRHVTGDDKALTVQAASDHPIADIFRALKHAIGRERVSMRYGERPPRRLLDRLGL
jgi:IS66 C-terminal element